MGDERGTLREAIAVVLQSLEPDWPHGKAVNRADAVLHVVTAAERRPALLGLRREGYSASSNGSETGGMFSNARITSSKSPSTFSGSSSSGFFGCGIQGV